MVKQNQEKSKLQDKIDEVKAEGVLKEKSISTLESHKESLEGLLKERDEIIEKLDSELDEAYNQNSDEKEIIKRLKEEMNEQKFEQEKAIALINQENEYLEDKVKQLEQQLVDLTVEYEERASSMKNKIKDLKIHRLRDENRDKENENRYNCIYNISEDKLEDILNMKLTFIPDFYFVKVRSISSAKPAKKNKQSWEALKTFNDFDVYEIEVNDDDTDSNYVIERTSYQIFGLFKRLRKQYKDNKSLSHEYKFPENLNEVLFQSQYGDNSKSAKDKEMYCSKDLRQITIQHYLNEICKQEVFKKSLELSSFFETARFKYGL